jgi:hypothetical protein
MKDEKSSENFPTINSIPKKKMCKIKQTVLKN